MSIFIDNVNVHNAVISYARAFYDVEVMAGLGHVSPEVIYRCLTWENLPGPRRARVIDGNGNNLQSILEEGVEYLEGNDSNSWIANKGQTGENARIDIDLGREKNLNGFYLRNFHSGYNWEDGTEIF